MAVTPGTFTEQVAQRRQTPSHGKSVHTSGSITVDQTKFITDNNVAVTNLSIKNNGSWVPWKEINNYYPFSVGAVPDTATYKRALRLYDDPAQYPVFPFYTANQVDKKAAADAGDPGSNNFSTINSTVQFRLYSSVLRDCPNSWMDATDYKKLLYWNTWAQYIGGNTQWPDADEFWADWNGSSIDYRSWIHHNILGSSDWTVIEDVAGLRPRNDAEVELSRSTSAGATSPSTTSATGAPTCPSSGTTQPPAWCATRASRRATRSTSTAASPPTRRFHTSGLHSARMFGLCAAGHSGGHTRGEDEKP